MTKKKLELTQKVIELNTQEANKISAKYYDRTAMGRQFVKGENAWLCDTSTKKGKSNKLVRRWKAILILERLTDLNYRVCDANSSKVMTSPVHVDRLRRLKTNREMWFSKHPDTQPDEIDNLTQHKDTHPPSTVNANSQTVNHDKHNANAT
jgi:hypothetical protein